MERIQLAAIVFSLGFLGYVMWQIKNGKLREEYAFIWILSTIALIILSVWRSALDKLAYALGVYAPPNLLFAGAIFAVLVYLLHLSLTVSKLQYQTKTLAQELALLKQKLELKDK